MRIVSLDSYGKWNMFYQFEDICIDSILIICPCFCSQQRSGDEPIPGCIGVHEPGEDYCRPAEPTTPQIGRAHV